MNLGKFRGMVRDKEAWCAAVHGVTESDKQQANLPNHLPREILSLNKELSRELNSVSALARRTCKKEEGSMKNCLSTTGTPHLHMQASFIIQSPLTKALLKRQRPCTLLLMPGRLATVVYMATLLCWQWSCPTGGVQQPCRW